MVAVGLLSASSYSTELPTGPPEDLGQIVLSSRHSIFVDKKQYVIFLEMRSRKSKGNPSPYDIDTSVKYLECDLEVSKKPYSVSLFGEGEQAMRFVDENMDGIWEIIEKIEISKAFTGDYYPGCGVLKEN